MSAGGNSKSRVMWRLERRGVARDAAAPELTIITHTRFVNPRVSLHDILSNAYIANRTFGIFLIFLIFWFFFLSLLVFIQEFPHQESSWEAAAPEG